MEGMIEVNGVNLWHRITGEGEPVIQIHGAGFGHFNLDPATPVLSQHFQVVDFDMRGYGASDKPLQHYDMEVWADDIAALQDVLGISESHIHGTSMGGMIAITFAGKYPERTTSVVINCAAAKLGRAGRLIFKNWIDIARAGPGRAGQPHPRRADLLAGRLEGVARVRGRPGDRRPLPADPPRLEPRRGLHRRLPGHVRHGHHAVARRRSPRRRSCSAATRTS